MEIFRLGNIEVIPYVFFMRDGMNDPLCLEDSFGNLARILPVLNEEKIQKQMWEMLFPNAKRMNWKVSVSPISDLWKRVRMSLGHEFIGKKARPSRDSVLEFWSSKASCSETNNILCISSFKNVELTIC